MIGALPESLNVGGREYAIRSDFRNVLQVREAFSDPDLDNAEKWIVAIFLLFEDFSCADDVEKAVEDGFDVKEAAEGIKWFIEAGSEENNSCELPTYDWAKDEQMIFSAVNKVANRETRAEEYMHWWTFIGYFNEIDEGIFSFIVGIRDKLNKGKKLEKHEMEFLRKNRKMIEIRKPKTREEMQQEKEYQDLLTRVLG